ncbi:MAG: dihydrodipicolinate synthase family protein [Planctomycetota bacterium]
MTYAPSNNSTRYRGIIPPLVTPLRNRDALDEAGLERLVEHVIAGGVSGLFILGTTGEAPSLSYRLRGEMIRRVTGIVSRRVPVLVGITDTAFVESIQLARIAAEAGADAVVLATPYYFPAGQTELVGYIQNITRELPLPLLLYNMPSLTKVWFEIETLRRLADLESIVGVKDSSGDLEYFARLVELRTVRPDWSLFVGPEEHLAEAVRLGASGGVSGGANVFPRVFVECYEAAATGNRDRALALQQKIDEFGQVYAIGKYASRFIKATKCALSLRGICDDFMAEPFHRFLPPEREKVRQILSAGFPEAITEVVSP